MATLHQLQEGLVKAHSAGNKEDAGKFASAIREHPTFQNKARESLEMGFKALDGEERKRAIAKNAARSLGLKDDDIDVERGMGLKGRFQLNALPDDQSRVQFLEKKYGEENVEMLNIAGKPKVFYRDPKTQKMTMVDEMGASLADFTADIASEAITTAGAVVGAVAGTAAAPFTGGVVNPVTGAVAGAALGGFATGLAQDVGAEVATGQDIELGQKVRQRGLEAAIGIPIDFATAGVGRLFSRGIAGRSGREAFRSEFQQALDRVEKSDFVRGVDVRLDAPEALRMPETSRSASGLAAARPTSKIAKDLSFFRQNLQALKRITTGEGSPGERFDDFNEVAARVTESYRSVVDDIAQTDAALAKEIEGGLSRKFQKMVAPKISDEQAGSMMRELITPGVKEIERINNLNFETLKEVGADKMVPTKSIIQAIKEAESQFTRLSDPTSKAVAKSLSDKSEISFNEFREVIDQISDSVSRNKEAGFSTKERVATRVLENLRGLRSTVAKNDPQLGDSLDNALNFYKENLLDTKRSSLGRTFREQLADPALTDSQVAKLTISDPAYIRQALRVAGQSGGPEAQVLKKELRDVYMNKIGLSDSIDPKNFKFNEDIVRELWGNRQVRDLQNLQKRLKQAKGVKVADISREDVYELFSAFSGDEKGRIMGRIVERAKKQKRLNSMLNTKLLKKLQPKKAPNGEWLEPEMTGFDLAKFSKSFVDASPSQVQRAMKALKEQGNERSIKAFQQSYIGNLFDRFSSGAQVDRFGNPMWNPEAMREALKPSSNVYQNLQSVLGKEGADDMVALNKLALEAMETRGTQVQEIFQPRYSLTSGGIQFYGVGNLIGGLRGRALAWAYRSKRATQLIQFLTSDVSDEATEKQLQKLLPALLTTSEGLSAIALQGTFDPTFIEEIEPLMNVSQLDEE